jgi:hypothetical protein
VSTPLLGPAAGGRAQPGIAGSATGFFATWSDSRFFGDVRGARFDAAGRVLDGDVPIAAGRMFADIASDGRDYLALLIDFDCGGIGVVPIGHDGAVGAPTHITDIQGCPISGGSIVSNGSSYLVVYGTAYLRYALFDRNGKLLRGPLSLAPLTRVADVASNGSDYLVAGFVGEFDPHDVATVSIAANGDPGPAHTVMSMTDQTDLALASDGTKYLLLTTGFPLTTQLIGVDGVPVGALHSESLPQTFNARLTWTGNEYLASWTTFQRPFTTVLNIGRVAADGTLLSARTSTITDSTQPSDFATAGGRTMLVTAASREIYAAPIAAHDVDSGAIPAGELLSMSAAPQQQPRMAALPEGAVIVWTEIDASSAGHLLGRLLDDNGRPYGPIAEVGALNSVSHQVAFDGTNIVVAALNTNSGFFLAQRFTTSLQAVDPEPVVVGKRSSVAEEFALAAGGGRALFAWTSSRTIDGAILAEGSTTPLPLAIATDNDLNPPATAWNGSEFVVGYSSNAPRLKSAVVAVRIAVDGRRLDNEAKVIAELESPAVRPALTADDGRVFGAWGSYGTEGRIFGAASAFGDAPATPAVLSPVGIQEGPFVADATIVAWTTHEDDAAQLQWRTLSNGAIAALPPEPRFFRLDPAIVTIGHALFAAYPRYDERAGGVSRIYVHYAPPPRRRALR